MAGAYSLDLRQKVMSFVAQGQNKREAAKIFNIGEDTIYRWLRREKAGDLRAKKRTEFWTKVPLETLRKYVEEHPDQTLKEIGQAVGLNASKVHKHLKNMGITRKKRPHSMRSVVQRSGLCFNKK